MHTPVLLNAVIEQLNPQPGQKFIDATINGGGHARVILERIQPGGKLLGIEWDSVIFGNLELGIKNQEWGTNLVLINESYTHLAEIVQREGFTEADGILFDLGFSSWHLEEAGRGFTFQKDEPLDMRYRPDDLTLTPAAEIVNRWSAPELERILRDYGEERLAGRIAGALVAARKRERLLTTFQLVAVIKLAVPFWYRRGRLHFATRTFQALRIAVNHELENIPLGLEQAVQTLRIGGRLAVITFHSLEDRIVKNFFRTQPNLKIITKKPIPVQWEEVKINPRARSAKLRVAERI